MLLSKIKVIGRSMEPTLKHRQTVIASSIPFFFRKPKIGDVVVVQHERCIIKRISKINEEKFFLVGDNKNESTDSRSFGWIDKKEIIGKVVFKI